MASAQRPLKEIYDDLWDVNSLDRWARSQGGLQPRSPGHLLELVSGIGLGPASSILDVGCGRGDYACELAERFSARVVAIDPVDSNLTSARTLVRERDLGALVEVRPGVVERLEFDDASFDLVWCRGVVIHLLDVFPALRECWRVLVPGGFMLLQTGFATELLEPEEARLLQQRLRFEDASMRRPEVEAAMAAVGFAVVRSETYGSEFAEFYEERDGRCGQHLAGIARLRRSRSVVIEKFGEAAYETALGMYHWQVYQMLGKVEYHAYLLRKV